MSNFATSMQSVPITTSEFNSHSWQGVLDTRLCHKVCQVCGFLRVLRLPPPIKLAATI